MLGTDGCPSETLQNLCVFAKVWSSHGRFIWALAMLPALQQRLSFASGRRHPVSGGFGGPGGGPGVGQGLGDDVFLQQRPLLWSLTLAIIGQL